MSSPALTGVPTAPTAVANTSTTQIATTEYVVGQSYAKTASPTFTGTVVLPSTTSIGTITSTELGYVDGVTSSIQTQINTKSPSVSPTFTGTVVLPSTTSIGTVDSAEIGYLDGVTSAIQTQINSKLATTAFTYAGITKATYATVGSLPASASNTGKVMYVQADGYMYYSTGSTWTKVAKFNDVTTSSPVGINSLTDVDTSTVAPTNNQVLGWNGTNWIPVNQTGSSGSVSLTLTEITDVDTSTPPMVGDALLYNGTNWVPGAPTFDSYYADLLDTSLLNISIDTLYMPAITRLDVAASGMSGYTFGTQYNNAVNSTIWAISGTTIAFRLNTPGHPFLIQTSAGANYNVGLVHVDASGNLSIGSDAQGKTSGTLYWTIPIDINGNYKYQCSIHTGMNGIITIKDLRAI